MKNKTRTFKFSNTNIAKWNSIGRDLLFDTYQECLVCVALASGTKTFFYRYKDQDKKIKLKKIFRFIEDAQTNTVEEARLKVLEYQKAKRDGKPIKEENTKTVHYLAKKFLSEALEGYRVSYLIGKSKLMVKYEDKTKREIKNYINSYVLLKTKDQELKDKLTRPLTQININFKDKLVEKLERSDIEDLMSKLSDSPYSANRLKAWLSTMFEWGIYKKLFTKNPTMGVGKNIENKVKDFLEGGDVKRVYNYINSNLSINAHFKVLVGLSLDTGLRLQHLFEIRWDKPKTESERRESRGYVDFKNKKIRIHRAKNKKPFNLDLANQSVVWLKQLRELLQTKQYSWAYKSKWVFPKPKTKEDKPFDYDSYKARLKKMIKYLELPEDFKLKLSRKTFVTHTARQHGIEIASRKAGHSDTKVTVEHYYTPDDEELKIDSIYGEKGDDIVQLKAIKGND